METQKRRKRAQETFSNDWQFSLLSLENKTKEACPFFSIDSNLHG
jgi:hypothetical protein